jgi:imidazolonepropionase-like amidohydrolase
VTREIVAADLVLPGPAGESVAGGAVLIEDQTVRDVGPLAAVTERAGAGTPLVRYPGCTILPGLIDTHVHLAFDASPNPVASLRATDDATLYADMAARARQLLDSGVTTVRDLGDRGALAVRIRDAVATGALPGPRVLAACAPITLVGGHCWFLGGEVNGPDAIRAMVRRNVGHGADLIKIMVTGGNLTPGGPPVWMPQFTTAEISVAVAEARAAGLRIAAHAHGVGGIEAALRAGVDTIEHCTFTSERGMMAGPAVRTDLVDEIAASGTFVCPTLSAAMNDAVGVLEPAILRAWLDSYQMLYERGVRLIAGTDAGIPSAGFDRYADGLLWLNRSGIPAPDVIALATANAAEAIGLGGEIGRLAAEHTADLIVVDGDPRTDLAVLARPRLVFRAGRRHVPADAAEPDAQGRSVR